MHLQIKWISQIGNCAFVSKEIFSYCRHIPSAPLTTFLVTPRCLSLALFVLQFLQNFAEAPGENGDARRQMKKKEMKKKTKLTGDSQSYRQPTLAREYFRTMIVMAFFSYFFSQVNTTKHMLSWNASADNALAIQQLTRILVFFWKRVSFLKISFQRNTVQEPQLLFVAGTRPISHRVGRSVRHTLLFCIFVL